MRILNDDEIYSAVTEGFGRKVKANNLTDEIALKRHEAAKMVAKVQHQQDLKDFIHLIEAGTADGKWLSDILGELKQLLED